MKKWMAILLSCMLMISVMTAGAAAAYTPGTYAASMQGFGGAVEVTIEVDADSILNVKAVGESETTGIGSKAIEELPAAIAAAQGTEVDKVSGATVTSKAVIDAANEALRQAKGEAAAAVSFIPGTYEAVQYGNNDYIHVQVVFDEKGIVSIDVPKHSETQFMGEKAIELISKDIVAYQTLNVDSVSGATITSSALKAAVADCVKQAGVDAAALQSAVPPKGEKKADVTVEQADVIVVGAGGAGLAAAATAAQNGKNVIVIEKMPIIGGNTLRCASAYNTADPERQAALPMTDALKKTVEKALSEQPVSDAHAQLIADVKAEYEAYLASGEQKLFDCPAWHALQTYNGGDKVGHIDLIRQYAENTLETMNWMIGLGTPVTAKVSQGAGALWQRTHQIDAPAGTGFIAPLYVDEFGSAYQYMGASGVILATGGYSNNKEMRQASNPALTADMVSTNQPGATGDGIIMATAIGAATTGMDYVQTYPLATPGSGALQGRARKMSGLDDVIVVNKEGLRFVHEDARRDDFVAAIKQQTDGIVYDINDSTIVQETNSFAENVETLVALGRIYKADTLTELAVMLGMPEGNLEKTVAQFNEMVANKEDPVFGRALFDRPIEVGPFYATPRAPSIHHTMGGLLINPQAQVMTEEGAAIEGLYAAGEVTGGIHGSNRLGGNATADVLTYGRIAGNSVSK